MDAELEAGQCWVGRAANYARTDLAVRAADRPNGADSGQVAIAVQGCKIRRERGWPWRAPGIRPEISNRWFDEVDAAALMLLCNIPAQCGS